jgi:hypothetical protein
MINMAIIAASMGRKIEMTDMTIEVPVSMVETKGFAIPPVVAVEANRVVLELPATAAAVPPPAIIAKDQVTTGLKSAIVESMMAVPAKAASGTAILSNKLSIYGIKYATISTKVAAPKVMRAPVLPIHSQDSLSCQTSKKAARLKANKGKNTLNPTEADKPTPRQILNIVSKVIFNFN